MFSFNWAKAETWQRSKNLFYWVKTTKSWGLNQAEFREISKIQNYLIDSNPLNFRFNQWLSFLIIENIKNLVDYKEKIQSFWSSTY